MIEQRPDGSVIADVGLPTRIVVPAGGPVVAMQDTRDDGYPDVILDQRAGYAGMEAQSQEEVFAFWERHLAGQRPPIRPWVSPDGVVPYINHSRWVADCSCGGGMLCWDQSPYACCLDCGGFFQVHWPIPALRSEVIRILAAREPRNRNWDPRKVDKQGDAVETVEFLQRENLLMGI